LDNRIRLDLDAACTYVAIGEMGFITLNLLPFFANDLLLGYTWSARMDGIFLVFFGADHPNCNGFR
jgi:hypothetical protein